MKIVNGKYGSTVVSSTEYQLYDNILHENGIYEKDLSENDQYSAFLLRQRGILIRVKDNGQSKYKAFQKKY